MKYVGVCFSTIRPVTDKCSIGNSVGEAIGELYLKKLMPEVFSEATDYAAVYDIETKRLVAWVYEGEWELIDENSLEDNE